MISWATLIAAGCMATTNAELPVHPADDPSAAARLQWRVVNDTVMGGRSNSRVAVEGDQLIFRGVLDTNGGGFASMRSDPQTWDLADYSRVRLRVRGDGREYRVRLFVANDRASYQHKFPTTANEWTTVNLPIEAFYASWRGQRQARPPLVQHVCNAPNSLRVA